MFVVHTTNEAPKVFMMHAEFAVSTLMLPAAPVKLSVYDFPDKSCAPRLHYDALSAGRKRIR